MALSITRFYIHSTIHPLFCLPTKSRAVVKVIKVCKNKVAESFNEFFVKKISDLKDNIDPNKVKDPLERIAEKVKHKT